MKWRCFFCGREFDQLPEKLRCPHCGHCIFVKKRSQIVRTVKAV